MRLIRTIYLKDYEAFQKRFSTLFNYIIRMPYEEFMKLTEQDVLSLKIRRNRVMFVEDEND